MSSSLLVLRLVLASVMGVAGAAKLLDRTGSRQSMREFGVPDRLAGALAVALPVAELACAVALIPAVSAWWGSIGALALLSAFIIAIAINLARGRTPDCHCFGKLHSEPVGWSTVGRNTVLAAGAAFVVSQGPNGAGPGLVEWMQVLSYESSMFLGLGLGLLMVAAFGLVVFVQLLAQNGRLMLRVEALEGKAGATAQPATAAGLAVGSQAPNFTLAGLDGLPVALDAFRDFSKPVLLFFSEPGCSACEELLPEIGRWQRAHKDRLLIMPISRGGRQTNEGKVVAYGLENLLLQNDREVFDGYEVRVTPSAVLIKEGLVASALAAGGAEIRTLVFDATLPQPVKRADPAPSVELPDLDNNVLDLGGIRGRRTVLLFWNPACGFCASMLQDIKSWERTRARSAPELVVVSAGAAEPNREQGFRSRVLLDPSFGAGRVFGASGTPSAVLIDEHGVVSSEVVVGAEAVIGLLQAAPRADAILA